jgi:2,5-dichlorohydroquinone reductive dechlorinase
MVGVFIVAISEIGVGQSGAPKHNIELLIEGGRRMLDDTEAKFERLAAAAQSSVVPKDRQRLVGPAGHGGAPDFDLYHFGFSICSNKVRAVLGELGASWRSFELDPAKHENYKPDYVRLRLSSEGARGGDFATGWEGGSSVAESGFDALVVPTLVDYRRSEVVADSLSICLHLVRASALADTLLPGDLDTDIRAQLDLVDKTPHVALLYGANPDGDTRAYIYRRVFKGEHLAKAAAAELQAATVKGESNAMDAAYAAKIAKEKAGSAFVASPAKMRHSVKTVDGLIGSLNDTLAQTNGRWIFGDRYTLADVFWGVSLFRLEYLGYGALFRGRAEHAAVGHYADRLYARPAISAAVPHWPSHPWSRPAAKWMPRPGWKKWVLGLGS